MSRLLASNAASFGVIHPLLGSFPLPRWVLMCQPLIGTSGCWNDFRQGLRWAHALWFIGAEAYGKLSRFCHQRFAIISRSRKEYLDQQPSTRGVLWRWLAWFAFSNGLVLALLALQFLQAGSWPQQTLAQVYVPLQLLGHFMFFAFLPWPFLALLVLLLPRKGWLLPAAIAVYSLLQLLLQIDLRVYALYRFHLNGMVWDMVTSSAAGEILVFDAVNYLIAAAVALVIVVLEYLCAIYLWRRLQSPARWRGKTTAVLTLLVMLVGQGIYAWADANRLTEVTRQIQILPLPQPLQMEATFRDWGWITSSAAAELIPVDDDTDTNFAYPLAPMQCQPPAQPYNILVIALDGMRFDMLNTAVTPHLAELANESWQFDNHYSSGNATRYGVFGLFYGLHGTYWQAALREQRGAVLIRQLRDQGYQFGLFASARLTHPEFDRTVFADIQAQVPTSTPGNSVVARDQKIAEQMQDFITNAGERPFFGFVFFDAPHAYVYPDEANAPFQPAWARVNYTTLDANADTSGFVNRYRNSIYFDDQLAGNILETLRASGHWDDTIVIVTGDHGQEFNESRGNYWGHNGNFSRYQAQVPLVVRWPGKTPAHFSHLSSHVDLAPTLLQDALGCSNPSSDYSNGRHLLDQSPRDYVVASSWGQFAIIQPQQTEVFWDLGYSQNYDSEYQELDDASTSPAINLQVMQDMSRFMAH